MSFTSHLHRPYHIGIIFITNIGLVLLGNQLPLARRWQRKQSLPRDSLARRRWSQASTRANWLASLGMWLLSSRRSRRQQANTRCRLWYIILLAVVMYLSGSLRNAREDFLGVCAWSFQNWQLFQNYFTVAKLETKRFLSQPRLNLLVFCGQVRWTFLEWINI
jgi:hypothetical protein